MTEELVDAMLDGEEELEDPQGTNAKEKQEEIVSHKMSREEREDLIHSLEHIVTVGSSNRRAAKRAKEWEKRTEEWEKKKQHELQGDHSIGDKEGGGNYAAMPIQMMHSEDVRIYGKNGYVQNNWPTKSRISRNDIEWDIEHGDCIHPLAFLEARLSDDPPSKRQRVDRSNLSIDKTDSTVALDEVPRAMLVRCWERAVHAASALIDYDGELREEETGVADEMSLEDQTTYSVDNAAKKCQDLNIRIRPGNRQQACPACGIMFESHEDLRQHFFGRSNQQCGCCWTKIRKAQYKLLDQMLQREVTGCADGLIQIVMSFLDKSSGRTEASNGSPPTQSWKDVLLVLESTCNSAHFQVHLADHTGTSETIKYEQRRGYITLNPHLIRNAKLRLIERYANIPR